MKLIKTLFTITMALCLTAYAIAGQAMVTGLNRAAQQFTGLAAPFELSLLVNKASLTSVFTSLKNAV